MYMHLLKLILFMQWLQPQPDCLTVDILSELRGLLLLTILTDTNLINNHKKLLLIKSYIIIYIYYIIIYNLDIIIDTYYTKILNHKKIIYNSQ